jgi:hypothetical protein
MLLVFDSSRFLFNWFVIGTYPERVFDNSGQSQWQLLIIGDYIGPNGNGAPPDGHSSYNGFPFPSDSEDPDEHHF